MKRRVRGGSERIVLLMLALAACGGDDQGSNPGRVVQCGPPSPSKMLYDTCGPCLTGMAGGDDCTAPEATCAAPCPAAPSAKFGGVLAGTCLTIGANTPYCSKECSTDADCIPGTCDFGPLHIVDGIVIDPSKYCIKN